MMLVEETSVPETALPVTEFREHLRLGTGFADDTLQDPVLGSFLRAALAAIEARTGKILLVREFSVNLNQWRDAARQVLPVAPVQQITAVTELNQDWVETDIASEAWYLRSDASEPALVAYNGALPIIRPDHTVRINFVAGMAQEFGDLPADLAQAVLMLAAHYYEFRASTGMADTGLPYGVLVLIDRYKTVRLVLGGRR